MAIRFRTSIIVAFGLLVLYFVFWGNDKPFKSGSHTIDVFKGATGTDTYEQDLVDPGPPGNATPEPTLSAGSGLGHGTSTRSAATKGTAISVAVDRESSTSPALPRISTPPTDAGSSSNPAAPEPTSASAPVDNLTLQEQFDKEYDALGL